jgi:hypothetical protein
MGRVRWGKGGWRMPQERKTGDQPERRREEWAATGCRIVKRCREKAEVN